MEIISGGQTGVDRLALDIARSLGIKTGGTAHKYFLTEKGVDLSLKEYGLVECEEFGYPARTKKNVMDSDATVWFGDGDTSGYHRTAADCRAAGKEMFCNPNAEQLVAWIIDRKIKVLNIAGNRGSKLAAETAAEIFHVIVTALKELIEKGYVRVVSPIHQSAGEG
jgi:hypothetical protein